MRFSNINIIIAVALISLLNFSACGSKSDTGETSEISKQTETNKKLISRAITVGKLGAMRHIISKIYFDNDMSNAQSLEEILNSPHASTIPQLELENHPATTELNIYNEDPCEEGSGIVDLRKFLDGSKLADSGKWGYVADQNSVCFGYLFIDCTHLNSRGRPWYKD